MVYPLLIRVQGEGIWSILENHSPFCVTMLAIWITGSISASGKMPFLPAHSISKLRMRRGAIFCQEPSGECEIKASYLAIVSLICMMIEKIFNTSCEARFDNENACVGLGLICTCLPEPRSSSYQRPCTS